jgi:hypothetical protein
VIKKICIFVLTITLFLALFSPYPVQAQGGIEILSSTVRVEFPYNIDFSLSARSGVNITDIRLNYTIDRRAYSQVVSEIFIEFVPDTTVGIRGELDMIKVGGLPPGSSLEYWWTVTDANGDKVQTTPSEVNFDDNRYLWRSLTEEKVTIYWYEGTQSFGEELMSTAQQALERLYEDTGAYLKESVQIYIYANSQDLQGAMIFPQEWTGGVAFTEYGTIAIGIDASNLVWGKRAITHELTHLVVHQMTHNPYIDLPVWLDEGLAMYTEGPLSSGFVSSLDMAIEQNSLISVRSLSSPFSAYSDKSYLSYAQSYSLVEFLITGYGQDKMLELLNIFSQGSNYDDALEKVYGFDMDGLNTLWQGYVVPQYQEAGAKTTVVIPDSIGMSTEFNHVLLSKLFLTSPNYARS